MPDTNTPPATGRDHDECGGWEPHSSTCDECGSSTHTNGEIVHCDSCTWWEELDGCGNPVTVSFSDLVWWIFRLAVIGFAFGLGAAVVPWPAAEQKLAFVAAVGLYSAGLLAVVLAALSMSGLFAPSRGECHD